MPGKIAFKNDTSSVGVDKSSASIEIGGASERSEIKTVEIGDVGLGCCRLRMGGCEAERENVYILSVFVL